MSTKSVESAKSAKNKSALGGLDDSANVSGVTPLGLAVAALIICVLASLAVPRLRAVSEERARPEGQRVLSAYESPRPAAAAAVWARVGRVSEEIHWYYKQPSADYLISRYLF